MNPPSNVDLGPGAVLIFSESAQGHIRCSQLCEMAIHYFCVQPEKLSGVLTLSEQKILYNVSLREEYTVRLLPGHKPLAQKFGSICENQKSCPAFSRLELLDLFVQAFEGDLTPKKEPVVNEDAAKERLASVLTEMYPMDMLQTSFAGLAEKVRCSPRHLARVFQQVTGASFKEKQAQLRLTKAQELLTNTDWKVIDVAFESGYRSLSLFNLMFKRQFGVTPGQWRNRITPRQLRNGIGQSARL